MEMTTEHAYAGDPRVIPDDDGNGFTVYHDCQDYRILYTPGGVFGWAVYVGPDLHYATAQDGDGRNIMLINFDAAADAIGALLGDPCVIANVDGTYTITGDVDDSYAYDGPWTVRDTGAGWIAEHPRDGFDDDPFFATAGDAINAVLGDPTYARRYGEENEDHG
jgi:hypothetical protein